MLAVAGARLAASRRRASSGVMPAAGTSRLSAMYWRIAAHSSLAAAGESAVAGASRSERDKSDTCAAFRGAARTVCFRLERRWAGNGSAFADSGPPGGSARGLARPVRRPGRAVRESECGVRRLKCEARRAWPAHRNGFAQEGA